MVRNFPGQSVFTMFGGKPVRRAAAALGSVALSFIAGIAGAQEPGSARLPFGMIGIGPDQTARVSVAALALPPSPCQVVLGFFDERGNVVIARGGETLELGGPPMAPGPARRTVTLGSAGETAFLDLSGSAVLPLEAPARPLQIRPGVELATPDPCAGARLVTTVEVLRSKGASSILYPNPVPDVVAAADGSATVAFGMVGITNEQSARLSVVALQEPPVPCEVRLSFFDDRGALVVEGGTRAGAPAQSIVTLGSKGDSAALELAGLALVKPGPVDRPARIRAYAEVPPSPCADAWIVTTLQVVDVDGTTSLLYVAPALLTDPCATKPDGNYCSLELNQPGDPSTRFACQGGKAVGTSVCAFGCANGTCNDGGGGSS